MYAQKLAVSSAGASAAPAQAQWLARWCEEYFESYGGVEITADWNFPSAINVHYRPLGEVGLRLERARAITRFNRPRDRVARDGDDHFTLIINRGDTPTQRLTTSQMTVVPPGSTILFDRSESSAHVCPAGCHRLVLIMPRRSTCGALPNVEDLVGRVVPQGNQALRLLSSYADGLLEDDDVSDLSVLDHAGQSLMDLAVLAFGTHRDNIEIARQRGLRAARLAAVLRSIRADFADPELTPELVARRVDISTRYLHDLLHETGSSFSERVAELRLAKAFRLLCDGRGRVRTVTEAAFEAGFSDLSYFVRSFRRKYGMTPTAARGRPEDIAR